MASQPTACRLPSPGRRLSTPLLRDCNCKTNLVPAWQVADAEPGDAKAVNMEFATCKATGPARCSAVISFLTNTRDIKQGTLLLKAPSVKTPEVKGVKRVLDLAGDKGKSSKRSSV